IPHFRKHVQGKPFQNDPVLHIRAFEKSFTVAQIPEEEWPRMFRASLEVPEDTWYTEIAEKHKDVWNWEVAKEQFIKKFKHINTDHDLLQKMEKLRVSPTYSVEKYTDKFFELLRGLQSGKNGKEY